MTNQNRPAFAQALGILAEALGQPLSELRVEGYFAALRDLDLEDVLHAVETAMRTEEYPVLPTPGKLRTLAQGTVADEAEAAWLAFLEAVRRVGSYGTPTLPPAIDATLRAVYGGWVLACQELPGPSMRTFEDHRRRFLAAYRVVQQRQALPPMPSVISGLIES